MTIFATASRAEEIGPEFWILWWILFIAAAVAAISGIGLRLFMRSRHPLELWLSSAALLVALYPVIFAGYVHHIDFVEVGGDGTRASGPYWKALAIPSIPLIISLLLTAHYFLSKRRQT